MMHMGMVSAIQFWFLYQMCCRSEGLISRDELSDLTRAMHDADEMLYKGKDTG